MFWYIFIFRCAIETVCVENNFRFSLDLDLEPIMKIFRRAEAQLTPSRAPQSLTSTSQKQNRTKYPTHGACEDKNVPNGRNYLIAKTEARE